MHKCVRCSSELNNSNWFLSFQKKNLKKCKSCVPKITSEKRKAAYAKYKLLILNKLGNACSCEKCNIKDPEILSIDHIHGGGIQEKRIRRGMEYLRHLDNLPIKELKNNYQLLCYNCNYSKGYYGICGHLLEMQ